MTWEYKDKDCFLWKIKLILTNEDMYGNLTWEYMITRAQDVPWTIDRGFFKKNSTPTLGDIMSIFLSHMTQIAFQITESA